MCVRARRTPRTPLPDSHCVSTTSSRSPPPLSSRSADPYDRPAMGTETKGSARGRIWLKRAALALIGILAALGVSEAALRILDIERLPFTNPDLYEVHGELSYRMRPNVRVYSHGTWFETNELGLRGPTPDAVRARGKEPVVFVGDSVAVGFGVSFEQSVAGQYERRNERGWAGVSLATVGYNLWQQAALAKGHVERMRPKAAVWMLVGNDLEDPYPIFEPHIDGDGKGALEPVKRFLRRNSVLYAFTRKRWRHFVDSRAGAESAGGTGDLTVSAWTDGSARTEEAWQFLGDAIRDLRARLGPKAPLIVCTFPLGIPDAAHERLAELARRRGATWLDLRPLWPDKETYLREGSLGWDGHPDAESHARMAERVAEAIEQAVSALERGE